MTRLLRLAAAAFALALTVTPTAQAHEGHIHKIMGTVTMHHDNHLEVKAVDGKTSVIVLNQATKIVRGKEKVKPDDIRPGERIVVGAREVKNKEGKTSLIASEIRLAPRDATAAK